MPQIVPILMAMQLDVVFGKALLGTPKHPRYDDVRAALKHSLKRLRDRTVQLNYTCPEVTKK